MLIDTNLLRIDRDGGGIFRDMWSYSNAGKTINYSETVDFIIDYLYLGDSLTIENTAYYQRLVEVRPRIDIEKRCARFIALINSLRKEGQKKPIRLFKIIDDLYMIVGGHHRAAYAHLTTGKVEAEITDEIKYEWDLSPELIEQNVILYSKAFPKILTGNDSYSPVWWKNIYSITRNCYGRLNAILRDIIDLPGDSVLDIGSFNGFFAIAVKQIPNINHVDAIDFNSDCVEIMKQRSVQTGVKYRSLCGVVSDLCIGQQYDAIIYLDAFHHQAKGKREEEFELICKMAKDRIYFCLGKPELLNEYGFLSGYFKKLLWNYGFETKLLFFDAVDRPRYRRGHYVAKKRYVVKK